MPELFLFYIFSCLIISSAVMVIIVKNPVHSVLFLILAFISAAILLLLLEVEFISLIFIVVYVGAIAVLFLFVVMMLDIKITDLNKNFLKYFPIGSFLGFAFLVEILLILTEILEKTPYSFESNLYISWINKIDYLTNIETLGQVIYTSLFPYFLIAGIVLLVAMLGAVVLTLTFSKNYQNQSISRQTSRSFSKSSYTLSELKNKV